jgi:transcriptional regulator with XRE-family HTH domain
MTKDADKIRLEIVEKIRRLRQKNHWTQVRLARLLGLSQNRLSEIERGHGSFSAEQFLLILKIFNAPLRHFSSAPTVSEEKQLQNAIARFGASPLRENRDLLPTEKLENATAVIREVLTSSANPRQITALAPLIVKQPNSVGLNNLRLSFLGVGRINRLGWLFESTLTAVKNELQADALPRQWKDRYHRTAVLLENILHYPGFTVRPFQKNSGDPLEPEVLQSQEAFEETKTSRDQIAKKWGVVTRIKTEDFVHALKGTRENN